MEGAMLPQWVFQGLVLLASLLVFALGAAIALGIVVFLYDATQTRHALRRNFPLIGRLRYVFEHLGVFFRQYFFAMDREELPFNREQRTWVYRAAKNIDNTEAFGTTRDLMPPGTLLFVNTPFPVLERDAVKSLPITVGPYCEHPYETDSVFNISGMSYGAISKPAVKALSAGARKAGIWLNTGEGGLSPFHLEGGCDIVFQIGTAKYGVRTPEGGLDDDRLRAVAAHPEVKMIELKLSQGAKPGKGGLLPGAKVTEEIAAVRGIPVGQDSISPNRHPEVDTVAHLLDLVAHIRSVTGKPTGLKTVIGGYGWIDDLCDEIARRGMEQAPDFITVDSADGGTGAAPASLMDYVGLTVRESLPVVVDKLKAHGLRERIKVIASGKLIEPAQVAWALCVGADFVVSARGFMFALGCIQAMQCNKNTCPTGVTTHNPRLQRGLVPEDKAERVAHYARNVVKEVGVIAHSCGAREPRALRREHCRVVQANGRSITLEELFPSEASRGHTA